MFAKLSMISRLFQLEMQCVLNSQSNKVDNMNVGELLLGGSVSLVEVCALRVLF